MVQPVVHIYPPFPIRFPQTIDDETKPASWPDVRINKMLSHISDTWGSRGRASCPRTVHGIYVRQVLISRANQENSSLRVMAPRAQRRALSVAELSRAYHTPVHGRAKQHQLELHTPIPRDTPAHHLDAAQLCPIYAVLYPSYRRRRRRHRPCRCRHRAHPCAVRHTPYQKRVLSWQAFEDQRCSTMPEQRRDGAPGGCCP